MGCTNPSAGPARPGHRSATRSAYGNDCALNNPATSHPCRLFGADSLDLNLQLEPTDLGTLSANLHLLKRYSRALPICSPPLPRALRQLCEVCRIRRSVVTQLSAAGLHAGSSPRRATVRRMSGDERSDSAWSQRGVSACARLSCFAIVCNWCTASLWACRAAALPDTVDQLLE